MRTRIAIIGAGPAGMVLAHWLAARGIEAVVLERRTRDYVEGRVRAGVLEQGTVDILAALGLDGRLKREGLVHGGTNLAADGEMFRIDFQALTGGKAVTVYGQQEVMRDLFDAAPGRGIPLLFETGQLALHDVAGNPHVTFVHAGRQQCLDCDFVAGCDGSHGVSAASVPSPRRFERIYPFGWLGILADVPPAAEELIYASHERGFALASMRSSHRSRYYLQCALSEKIEDWSDQRFWDEVELRLGPMAKVTRGPSFEKSIAPLRSVVREPMRHGKLFLAGDAAHIVPPAGAKGLNLAVGDVALLAQALELFYRKNDSAGLDAYSARALRRVWQAERFSWWFTMLTHRFESADAFDRRMQLAELSYLKDSRVAQQAFAENYVGLPF
jgi:p-hydroxybenzoate 3-monooxygenase